MLAEAVSEVVTLLVLVIIPVLLVISLVLRGRARRREELLIRQWCDAKGYGLSRIRPFNSSLFALWLFLFVGWLWWWMAYKRAWRLRIYDNEGGEKTIVVHVHRSGQIVEQSYQSGQVEETWI